MKLIDTQITHMEDKYVVYQTINKKGKVNFVSYINNLYDDWNLKCQGSSSKYIAISYFGDVQATQQDTLNGLNPYLSKNNAWAYKICSSLDISTSDEEFVSQAQNKFSGKINQNIINKAINLKRLLLKKRKLESNNDAEITKIRKRKLETNNDPEIPTIKKKVIFNI